MDVITFLRDVGKHFSVNRMLDRDAVKTRLEGNGISYTEFSYVLLQSMDYLELRRRHGCTLQIGGSDQWGNITAGCELVRRVDGESVHALTTHLLTKSDGTKFGKTESGTVWLDPELTSPYAFYQFWFNTDDRDVINFLKIFSMRSQDEIAQLEEFTTTEPAARAAQKALAQDVTALVHGAAAVDQAIAASAALFGRAELADLERGRIGGSGGDRRRHHR
jgi:tyrosyl-tRNA synthetase